MPLAFTQEDFLVILYLYKCRLTLLYGVFFSRFNEIPFEVFSMAFPKYFGNILDKTFHFLWNILYC